ncbi:MAG: hypothetical protein MUC43_06080 [Pirellula sp.]|jgi:hypothetical protein|nr:hypothetical protein [Pirellula sp.]
METRWSSACPTILEFGPLVGVTSLLGSRGWAIVLGGLLAVVALALLVASWTKWGQQKPLTKCVALAFLAHVWLLMYAYGTRVSTPGTGGGSLGGQKTLSMHVTVQSSADTTQEPVPAMPETETEALSEKSDSTSELPDTVKPWESPIPNQLEETIVPPPPTEQTNEQIDAPPSPVDMAIVPDTLPIDDEALKQFLSSMASDSTDSQSNQIQPVLPSESDAQDSRETVATSSIPARDNTISTPVAASPQASSYQNRFAINRMEIVRAGGGDESTEASVQLALDWLARAQSSDGGWYAAQHGGGNPSMINRLGPDGERRQNAGARANTAMTGLAILAFLGAGHHHYEGQYSTTVAAGLRYLISQQKSSGDLSGHDQNGRDEVVRFARMYSHGMAALAIAEAYAITKDPALIPVVQRAADYSLRAMNPQSGGWRYEFPTNDPGDTSQFGWQAMFLKSAAAGEVTILDEYRRRMMQRFLDSVATGRDGGLATYRPRSSNGAMEAPTVSMTAEAMASRLLLGVPTSVAAQWEAQRMIVSQLPGEKEDNFYYWYYATLAMFQMRGSTEGDASWNRWNNAMKSKLVATQVTSGPDRGSWNPSCVWGPYGGRIYTTTLACLSLEVYYRYLPIYQTRQAAQWQPAQSPIR